MKCLALAICLLMPLPAMAQNPQGVIIFAAASLTDALGEIGHLWVQAGHAAPRLSFAASSTLARQIESGAPASIFASADEQWADYLEKKDLLAAGTRRDLLANDMVVIAPAGRASPVSISAGTDWSALLGATGRIATGDPAHVPVGLYAKQSLTKLGAWDSLKDRIAGAEDVRGALLLVARGEAPVGIVYATDAAVSKDVAVIGTFPPDSHDPITYPFALVKAGDSAEARALLAFIAGPQARAVFLAKGFRTE